jgi:hypothetical protein
MKPFRHFLAALLISISTTFCVAQNITWYKFDRDFINAKYSDSAIGNLSFTEPHPAGVVHSSSGSRLLFLIAYFPSSETIYN